MANKHTKRCSTSLIIKEMQIKTTMRSSHPGQNDPHQEFYKQTNKQNSTNNKCWRGCEEKGTLLHCWWECKLKQPLWKWYGDSLKN